MTTRFLFNAALWEELGRRVAKAKNVAAAVAYLGSGASDLLPLRKGHRLVVDMSLRAVRAGSTDPREVQKLLRRGVEVFTRGSLHAKFLVIDSIVIAGSANISKHARHVLDEGALLSDDRAAVARAAVILERLCSEPIRKDYLDKCLTQYRPPKLSLGERGRGKPSARLGSAKLWVIGGLRYIGLPESEKATVGRIASKARRKFAYERTEVDYIHFPSRPRYFDRIRVGEDWCIRCIREGERVDVHPPAQILGTEKYPRGGGRYRYLLLFESVAGSHDVPWSRVRSRIKALVPALDRPRPRTIAVRDDDQADTVLRLWDSRGRLRK